MQQRVATLSAERDEAVERLAAGTGIDGGVHGPSVEVGARVSAILSLADEEAAQVRAEAERFADELRRSADAEAQRMKAAAAAAADEIVRQANQEAAARRQADAARQAQLSNAEQAAAQIIESARGEAEIESQRARAEVATARESPRPDRHGPRWCPRAARPAGARDGGRCQAHRRSAAGRRGTGSRGRRHGRRVNADDDIMGTSTMTETSDTARLRGVLPGVQDGSAWVRP